MKHRHSKYDDRDRKQLSLEEQQIDRDREQHQLTKAEQAD